MLLTIPRPALVLLIGVSGSGKSTFARRQFQRTEVVSSDACRALVCDDEADQSATKDAFELLHLMLEKRLRRGKLTVVDATNVQAWGRASLLEIAARCGVPAVAILFDLPEAVVSGQNQSREGRVVDAAVIAQQSADMQAARAAVEGEGFVHIYTLRSREDVDGVTIHYS